jgi:hypothetical protein
MKADNFTQLARGRFRDRYLFKFMKWGFIDLPRCFSIRIESLASYNTGLFILDLNRAPWGCGTLLLVFAHLTRSNILCQAYGLHSGQSGEIGHM